MLPNIDTAVIHKLAIRGFELIARQNTSDDKRTADTSRVNSLFLKPDANQGGCELLGGHCRICVNVVTQPAHWNHWHVSCPFPVH